MMVNCFDVRCKLFDEKEDGTRSEEEREREEHRAECLKYLKKKTETTRATTTPPHPRYKDTARDL